MAADWGLYIVGLLPGESRFVPTGEDDLCMTRVVGICLHCETMWMVCSCGQNHVDCFDCECGENVELVDEYLQRRVTALEIAIRRHKKKTGEDTRDQDLALYAVYDEDENAPDPYGE